MRICRLAMSAIVAVAVVGPAKAEVIEVDSVLRGQLFRLKTCVETGRAN